MEQPHTLSNKLVVGIDIGGTNTELALVDSFGKLWSHRKFSTTQFKESIHLYIQALADAIKAMQKEVDSNKEIVGIGIGAPNGNYYSGTIPQAVNLPWKGELPLSQELTRLLGIPVVITNDANAAALGEQAYGSAKGMKDFYVITLGTGVGSGIVANGQLIYGYDGLAGELGHFIIEKEGRECGCGRRGCLETYCSATGLVRTARELLSNLPEGASSLQTVEHLTSKEIYELALARDSTARKVYQVTGHLLGFSLANFATFSSPEAIILFGGLTKAGQLLLQPTQQALDTYYLKAIHKPKLLISELADDSAALLGAAALGWEAAKSVSTFRSNNI